MKISFQQLKLIASDALVVIVNDTLKLSALSKTIDDKTGKSITKAIKIKGFKGKKGETLSIIAPSGVDYNAILVVGSGKESEINDLVAQNVGGKVYSAISSLKAKSAAVIIEKSKNSATLAANIAYGVKLKSYSFDKYKTKKEDEDKQVVGEVSLLVDDVAKAKNEFNALSKIADGVFLARDVVTEPPNKLYPESYAQIVKKEMESLGVKVTILGVKEMEKLGMGALLGVGQGSIRESKLVVMEYEGAGGKDKKPVAFVGKGVTFDTGGISIKPAQGMEDMKYDMGGSAAVVGAIKALAGRKAKVSAVGVIGLVENMPGGNAQRPSDVVKTMSGQTVEVLNTDAEGRLVLADALWYAQEKFNPQIVINLATLTGAIVIALGQEYAGLFSNNDKLSKHIEESGRETGERVWRFPLGEEYDKLLKSPIADMQNISNGRGAGSITAAQFLQRFIKKGTPWAHIDIAGVAWAKEEQDICPKGATAFGVRLLDKIVANYYEGK